VQVEDTGVLSLAETEGVVEGEEAVVSPCACREGGREGGREG